MGHITEDDAESYVMETLPAAEPARIEEHLLICDECRQRLIEVEQYIAAMRAAAASLGGSGAGE